MFQNLLGHAHWDACLLPFIDLYHKSDNLLHVGWTIVCTAVKYHDGCQAIITSGLTQGRSWCMTFWAFKAWYCSTKVRHVNQLVTFRIQVPEKCDDNLSSDDDQQSVGKTGSCWFAANGVQQPWVLLHMLMPYVQRGLVGLAYGLVSRRGVLFSLQSSCGLDAVATFPRFEGNTHGCFRPTCLVAQLSSLTRTTSAAQTGRRHLCCLWFGIAACSWTEMRIKVIYFMWPYSFVPRLSLASIER